MRVVIIGGGFGGVRCALDLSNRLEKGTEIILIDRSSAHVFTPTLYEVASAYRNAQGPSSLKLRRSVSIPYREIFKNTQVIHLQKELISLDPAAKTIYVRDGAVGYDYCVVAVGSQATDFGVPGVAQHAHFFKTVEDALKVNERLHRIFWQYVHGSREKPIQIVLAGAGFTGIELASEIASCLRKLGRTHKISKKFFSIILFEAAPQMLPMVSEKERSQFLKRLTDIGVAMFDHSSIESVQPDTVKLSNGHIWRSDMTVWTAGIKPNKALSLMPGLPLSPHGKIVVDVYLQVQGTQELFAVGDTAEFINPVSQQPVPAVAQAAIHQGRIAAANIAALIRGKSLKEYRPDAYGWIATVGGKFAIAHLTRSLVFRGFPGWVFRNLADLRYFTSILPVRPALDLFKREVVTFSEND